MIHIHIRRAGLLVLACTVNDFGEPTMSWGFTEEGARQRLLRVLG